MSDTRPSQFRRLLQGRTFFTAPGVYDGITALVADRVGFPALYFTGYGAVVSHLGLPDVGLGTYSDFVDRLKMIAERTSAPIIADADTGFGGLLNVRHTVRGYEAAGAAAIQIEDQEFPKRCGHTDGKRVIPTEEMVLKIKVAIDSRKNEDFCIVARTDARAVFGLDEAIRRGQAFAEAGADVIFVEAPLSENEMARIAAEIDAPVLANMIASGAKTPELPSWRLIELGYSFAIHPGVMMMSAATAMQDALLHLKEAGDTTGFDGPLMKLTDLHDLVGFPDAFEFDARWATEGNATGAAK